MAEVEQYLFNDSEYAKILTTPRGLKKVINVVKAISLKSPHINYKKLFFLLVDECHKLVKEANYRTDILEMMEHFFDFENKAMVSSTPIHRVIQGLKRPALNISK